MSRNRPANGSDAKRRKQAEDTTISGMRTGYRSRRNALRCSALRLLPRGIVSYEQVDERLAELRSLGKHPSGSLVSDVAQVFAWLDAAPGQST
jgi:hypothetical protein